jgi:hypothetical protein
MMLNTVLWRQMRRCKSPPSYPDVMTDPNTMPRASNSTVVTKDYDEDDTEDMEWPPRPERARHQQRSPILDPHDHRLGSLGSLEPLTIDIEPDSVMAEIGTSPVFLPELQIHGKGKSVE